MNEVTPGTGDVALEQPNAPRPEAEVMAQGEAAAVALHDLEANHALAEDPERRAADVKIWIENECDYFGIQPKDDPVADQLTELFCEHETSQHERGRDDYDVTQEAPRRLNRIIERGMTTEAEAEETATLETEATQMDAEQRAEDAETAAEISATETEATLTEEVEASADSYREAVAELAGQPNTEKIRALMNDERVPEAERARLQSFNQIMVIADRVPEDAPLIRQRINLLDMSQGVPDPVQFIQTAIFSSPDYESGVSEATQNAIAAEFNITPTRPAQPRNATEMQTTLREGQGTREITEIQRVEEPPGSGIFVEKEVVVGEELIPFDEQERLVLSTNPLITVFPDPPGGTLHRVEGEVEGSNPVHIFVDVPPEGAFPAAETNNRMNEQMQNTVFRNGGMTGVLEHFHGRGDSSLGAATETDFDSIGRNDMNQAILQTFIGENTTLGGRFLTGDELHNMEDGLRHLTPGGDFGAFNQMDPATANSLMTAMFGSDRANITASLNRARPFINTGGAETPSYEGLYAALYPEDAAGGYERLRGIIGSKGMARLDLGTRGNVTWDKAT